MKRKTRVHKKSENHSTVFILSMVDIRDERTYNNNNNKMMKKVEMRKKTFYISLLLFDLCRDIFIVIVFWVSR